MSTVTDWNWGGRSWDLPHNKISTEK